MKDIADKIAFVSLILAAAAMDSDNMIVPGAVCLVSALSLLWTSNRKETVEQSKTVSYLLDKRRGRSWDIRYVRIAVRTWIRMKDVTAGKKLRHRSRRTAGPDRLNMTIPKMIR